MKRVVAIVIIMAMVTSLFSFSVFADTPVQPLQVVTYSDTSTNVRISGTAERLHYQIDSFQVVFMNPPNNYGTSCTPILVSFRFYNASDIPAYVGQAEFEIMASSSTGAVNTTIYGYDQISTDLFIAESSYSTAEVGRIGIGASNDFAYYTGFVIPPKTSLYFSAIVYVNASAYEGVSTSTGSQESVNQITMSALNLYTNQISFSEDYPYHNQPIDFSDIINSISELADIVSTSSEMQNLIDVLTYSGSQYVPITDGSSYYDSGVTNTDLINFTTQIRRVLTGSFFNYNDYEIDSSNDTQNHIGSKTQYAYYSIVYRNDTNNYVRIGNYNYVDELIPSGRVAYEIVHFYSNFFSDPYLIRNNTGSQKRQLYYYVNNPINNYGYIPPNSIAHITVLLKISYDESYPPTYNVPIVGFSVVPVNVDNVYAPVSEYHILRDLFLSLVKNRADDNTQEAQDMNDDIHEAEQVWYDNNSEALEEVGLSNYRFSTSQSNGITQAVTQFQAVWNALGDWTNVYIFILILSISTYIIRHEPTTRVKQYRSSVQAERAERISYYGRKNAESRASSSGSTLKNAIRRRK